ncbi:Target of rapamycin complex 2 subunit MAPKAP1 [Tupaia chinensis]|uniref:Target of rapamycin complex 2 subunit MAPKAP1 n=1 Tax=Tupaia chinensis TaxID=246437 RepID=L9JD77_TUPCH|nr:Target of rapamycin complex 2 subunit MAPKAP1 [Tupaia chinensis]
MGQLRVQGRRERDQKSHAQPWSNLCTEGQKSGVTNTLLLTDVRGCRPGPQASVPHLCSQGTGPSLPGYCTAWTLAARAPGRTALAQLRALPSTLLCAWASRMRLASDQVNYILESRASTARAEYFAQKQRKLNRRTSFSFQKEKKSGQQ